MITMIKAGQIYKTTTDEIIVITQSEPQEKYLNILNIPISDFYSYINAKGEIGTICELELLKSVLIAEYPTWQESVNSKEFNE